MKSKVRKPLAVLLGIAAFAMSAGSAGAAVCPNEALLTGPSAQLPDCRGYELVSPARKGGFDVETEGIRAAASGPGVVFTAKGAAGPTASTPIFSYYLAHPAAGAGRWALKGVSPPIDPVGFINVVPFLDWSADLSKGVVQSLSDSPLDPEANPAGSDLYLRDNTTDVFTRLSHQAFLLAPSYGGASADLSHVVFGDTEPQTADTVAGESNLYEVDDGGVRLVDVAPEGAEPFPEGAVLGSGQREGDTEGAVSADGSRIFFSATPAGGSANQVYVGEDAAGTVEASASQRATPDPEGERPATYWAAAADGSSVFFTSPSELTDDANTGAADGGNDLYRFDVAGGGLADLTPDASATDPNGAEVLGVVGASEDGSYVYFVANGVLKEGQGTAGQPNLYLWHAGATRFIATLSPEDAGIDWTNAKRALASSLGTRVSPDGEQMLITTVSQQGAYDNAGHREIYRFDDVPSNSFTCVSCNPSQAPASADATLGPPFESLGPGEAAFLTRALDPAHGAVFFSSAEPLVAGDQNEAVDAYEWREGQLSLISSGTSDFPSYFADAEAESENVYFTTRAPLVASDEDQLMDVYDARIDGGTPPAAVSPPPCAGGECRGPGSQPAPAPEPGSSTLTGPGDPTPAHRAPPRRKRHQKKKQKHHKRRHSAHSRRNSRG